MKKTIFFAVLVFVSFSIKAQIINTNTTQIESATNDINQAQKVLKYKDGKCIILDKKAENPCLYLVGEDNTKTIAKNIPSELRVNDFSILGDSIYVCGYELSNKNTLNKGFIAYSSIEDMFFTGANCMSSLIPSTYDVYKIVTYYNSNNDRIVAAIGGQMYGDFVYMPKNLKLDNSNANQIQEKVNDENGLWEVKEPIERDCFITYKIWQEKNIYDIYCCSNKREVERFEEIAMKDDNIYVFSKYKSQSIANQEEEENIRQINKNDISKQVSKRCYTTKATNINDMIYFFNLPYEDNSIMTLIQTTNLYHCTFATGSKILSLPNTIETSLITNLK
jgi:hypothetical protein